jgi:hypothetical protein
MSKYNLLDIHEGMGYKEFEDAKEEERLDKHPDKEMIKKVKAMMAKEKSVKEGEAVDLAIEASQEKAGIKVDEDYKNDYANSEEDFTDSMVIEKIKDIIRYHELDPQDLIDEIRMEFGVDAMDEIVGYDRKGNKQTGTDVSKATQYKASAMKKDDDDDDELDESFDSLAKKLDKQKGITKDEAGKIAGKIANIKRKGGGKGPTSKQKKRMSEGVVKSIMQVLKDDAKATNDEIKQYLSSLMRSGDSFDDLDDYVEDFKNYVGDRSLGENERVAEADAIPTSAGEMKRGDDGKMYNVIASNAERKMAMRSVMDILRDELSVSQDDAFGYIKTHRDDLFDGTVDAFDRDDVVDDYKNYESVNESDANLREHFGRFLKDYQ